MSTESLPEFDPSEVAPPGGNGAAGASVDRIAFQLAEEMPSVQPHVIAEHEKQFEQTRTFEARDRNGAVFNEALHETDENGNPRQTVRGTWALKRGRGSAKARQNAKATEPAFSSVAGVPGTQVQTGREKARIAGETAATLLITAAVTVGGDEWQPIVRTDINLDEHANLRTSFADYFERKNIQDFPPGVALAIAVVGYVAPRCFMPVTKTRLQRFRGWIVQKYAHIRFGRSPADGTTKRQRDIFNDGTQSNFGDDGKRKDYARESASA
jgi:hypothetical protein